VKGHNGAPPVTGTERFMRRTLAPVLQYHHAALVFSISASRAFYVSRLLFLATTAATRFYITPTACPCTFRRGSSCIRQPTITKIHSWICPPKSITVATYQIVSRRFLAREISRKERGVAIRERVMPGDGLRAVFAAIPPTTLEFERNQVRWKVVEHFTEAS
jgi:hypothetical protein